MAHAQSLVSHAGIMEIVRCIDNAHDSEVVSIAFNNVSVAWRSSPLLQPLKTCLLIE